MFWRFDAHAHDYVDVDHGEVLPHISGLLKDAGLVDDKWFTEESCARGTLVHRMTADWDLGVIEEQDLPELTSLYKPYLLGHVKAMAIMQPSFSLVEEPLVHEQLRFGGRPDRAGTLYAAASVLEIKTGEEDDAHRVQTALQAILVAPLLGLPPEAINRYALYLKKTGKFRLIENTRRLDFDKAREILQRFAR